MNLPRRTFLRQLTAGTAGMGFGCVQARQAKPIGLELSSQPMTSEVSVKVGQDRAELRILQLTDLHFFCDRDKHGPSRDERTQRDLEALVQHFKPDLLAVTGDLWHDNPDHRGQEFFEFGRDAIAQLDTPWLFTWGNHDLLDHYDHAHKLLADSKHCLYRGGSTGGNYVIHLTDAQDEPLWDFVCVNTTNVGVQSAQETWLRQVAKVRTNPPPTLAFFHIPLLQYESVWLHSTAAGIQGEAVAAYGEDGSGFSCLKLLGNVRACFCGHDHVNDYGGVREGIELVYGRASGHAGYGGDEVRKGAKLITIDLDRRQHRWQTVFADGTHWQPEARR